LTVHCLIKMSMQKGILHIKLMDRPMSRCGKAEDSANGSKLNHSTESLIIIYAMLLRKSTDNPSSFMTCKRII